MEKGQFKIKRLWKTSLNRELMQGGSKPIEDVWEEHFELRGQQLQRM